MGARPCCRLQAPGLQLAAGCLIAFVTLTCLTGDRIYDRSDHLILCGLSVCGPGLAGSGSGSSHFLKSFYFLEWSRSDTMQHAHQTLECRFYLHPCHWLDCLQPDHNWPSIIYGSYIFSSWPWSALGARSVCGKVWNRDRMNLY